MNKYKYHQLKKQGICVNCQENKAIENRVKCDKCLKKDKIYQLEKRQLENQDQVTIFRLNKKKYRNNNFIIFLSSKSDFNIIGENKINYIFKYNGNVENAKFYLRTNKILYKNLKGGQIIV